MIYFQVAEPFINDRPLPRSQNAGLWKQNYFMIPTIKAYRKNDNAKIINIWHINSFQNKRT